MLQAEAIVYIHTLFDVCVCVVARWYPNVTALPLEGLFVNGERDVWKRCSLIPRPSPFLFLSLQTEEWIVLNAN